ncbi:MAG: conjugal transfer protein TraF [Nitrospirota bacterium]
MKRIIILGIGFNIILLFASTSYACLGARPLSMGGAFVAVADDVHSCYWNPAGMGNIKGVELTGMRTMNNRDVFNYQEWLAGAVEVGENSGLGGSYVHSIDWTYETELTTGRNYVFDSDWKVLSIGGYGQGIFKNTAFGVNVRNITYSLMTASGTGASTFGGGADFKKAGYETDAVGYDIGILHNFDEHFTIGILIQDVNKPEIDFSNSPLKQKYKYVRNFRPGVAWKPDDKTIFAVDLYDATLDNIYDDDVEGQSGVRIGFERWVTPVFAIRAGLYGQGFHTIGFGLKGSPQFTKVEISGMSEQPSKVEFQLDYGLLDDGAGTHLLSFGAKF